MKYSNLFGKTLRNTPHDIKSGSLAWLLKAGYIRSLGSGLFSFMPLGFRVIKKLEQEIRKEMELLGGQEVLVPLVNPLEIWKNTGRAMLIDRDMVRFRDRHGKDLVLSPSHEEAMVELVREVTNSYRDFPVFLFQFQTKFRDEDKVRSGLVRTKEFVMKDAYSFHRSHTDLNNFFPRVFAAYQKIFKSCGLDIITPEAGTGYMGGEKAYDFFICSDFGYDVVISCPGCGYTANREIAKGAKDYSLSNPAALEEIKTPDCKTMDDLSVFLNVSKEHLAKSMVYKTLDSYVMAVVRGDYEISIEKLSHITKSPVVRLASSAELELMGLVPGYLSPVGLKVNMQIVVDDAVANSSNLAAGANKKDYHYLNTNFGRDYESVCTADIVQIKKNNTCLLCGSRLEELRGMELGSIFKLGNFYSKSLGLSFKTENGTAVFPEMGSYGIGLGRLLSAVAEKNCDDKGLCWPANLAPFSVFLMGIGKSNTVRHVVNMIYDALDTEVLMDDRLESPGVKFKDADLLGIPYRIIVSTRWLEQDRVEIYERRTGNVYQIPLEDIINGSSELPWIKL